jgi:hypothetical protein
MTKTDGNWLMKGDRPFGVILLLIGIGGILHTIYGDWGLGAGEQAKMFPRAIYISIIALGIGFLVDKASEKEDKLPAVGLVTTAIFTGVGALFFILVYNLGVAVSIFIYTTAMFALLTVNPLKYWKQIVIPAICITIVLWIVFTRFMPVIVPRPLLF